MTSRDRVRAALEFAGPDRAPRDLWTLPYVSLFQQAELDALRAEYPMDVAAVQLSPETDDASTDVLSEGREYTDEWGSVWQVGEPGVIGEVKQPVLAEWQLLTEYQPPWDLIRNRDLSYANRWCEQTDQFVLSAIAARPFERMQFLRGTENLLLDIAYGTPEFDHLTTMVHQYYLEDVSTWCETKVDGVLLMDDWGTQKSLLISPNSWRSVFKSLYREYCQLIHAAGKYVFFHSDGHIEAIIGDLIEVGVDALNSQLFTMDIEGIARRHKGKVTFWGEIDRQWVLPFGTPADVREAVMRVRAALDDGRGGVIAQCEWGKGNPRENVAAVFEAWL